MFCHKCGSQLSENSKFCNNCGAISNSLSLDSKAGNITPAQQTSNTTNANEYIFKTNIKNKEEASKYLNRLKNLFLGVFVAMLIVRGSATINSDVYLLLFLAYLCLLGYFVYYCLKVLKAEKKPLAWAILSIVFAPISWIWLYYEITDPLKYITGEKQPPSEEELKRWKENSKKWWKKFLLIIGVIIGVTILFCILAVIFIK